MNMNYNSFRQNCIKHKIKCEECVLKNKKNEQNLNEKSCIEKKNKQKKFELKQWIKFKKKF